MVAFWGIEVATILMWTSCVLGVSGSLLNCRNILTSKQLAFKLWLVGDVVAIAWAYTSGQWGFFIMYMFMTGCCIYGLKDHGGIK